ncbi:MAG: SsrA-binding protein SmpB [Gammaproteobacteria bacterium]|nr:SsrA-binding protein SmpB [Gammaproteobacteria bacterium]MDH5630736.1 SsrA-binding protein SmpB [Gammaproteobacteria bacterium]
MGAKKKKLPDNTIAQNRKARHDYHIESDFEAGLVLQGWEVKAMRAQKANLTDAYIILQNGEAFLHGCHVSPLITTSTHIVAEPTRNRKLLLHDAELRKIIDAQQKDGYTIVPLALYWVRNLVKLKIATAKGKKLHDKRASEKAKQWNIEKQRVMKNNFN